MNEKQYNYGRPMSRREEISSALTKKYVAVYRDYGRSIKKRKNVKSIDLKRRMSNPLKKMIQFTTSEVNLQEIIEETVSSTAKNLDATCNDSLYSKIRIIAFIIIIIPDRIYIIDTDNDEIYYNLKDKQIRFKINTTSTIASNVACNKEYILLTDMSYNAKYPDGIGFTGKFVEPS